MVLGGRIDSTNVESSGGTQVTVPLEPGVHSVVLRLLLTGNRWKFVPMWNGRSAFRAATLTVGSPRTVDRWLAPLFGNATAGLVVLLLVAWIWRIVSSYAAEPQLLAWTVGASALMAAT